MEYTGTIVEESLLDNRILNTLKIIKVRISSDENPGDRWHLYTVKVSKDEINKISSNLKSTKWYAHFWNKKHIIAIFKDKQFEFNFDNKIEMQPAIEYGLSIGIPKEQLDFLID